MQRYKIILQFIRHVERSVLLLFLLNVMANVCALILPIIVSQLYAHLLNFDSARAKVFTQLTPQYALVFKHFSWLFVIFLGVLSLRLLLDFLRKKRQGILSEAFQYQLRTLIFNHHLKMDIDNYEQGGVGRYLLRFSGDLSSINNLWAKGILQLASDVTLLLLSLSVIAYLDVAIALIILSILGILFFIFKFLNKEIEKHERQKRTRKMHLLGFINARLLAISSIQAFNRETVEKQKLEKFASKIETEGAAYHHWFALSDSLAAAAMYVILGVCMVFLFYKKMYNPLAFDVSRVLAIILILLTWRQPLLRVLRVDIVWKKGLLSLDSLNRFLEKTTNPRYAIEEQKYTPSVLNIKNLDSKGKKSILYKSINTTVLNRNIYILEHENATVLIKTLAGLVPDTKQLITLDGTPISYLNARVVRRSMAFASPVFPLYGKTVFEALSSSNKKENKQKIRALFKTWAAQFPPLSILNLDTPFHENGMGLTPEQHQLLRLLNAFLTQKSFMILEEPLAFLDADSADIVWALLVEASASRGILILTKHAVSYKLRLEGQRILFDN